jgi:ABC-type lipoprotein export system ATPase subunit
MILENTQTKLLTMKIQLHHVMPTPLASIQHGPDSIWGADLKLEPGKRIVLNASSGKGKSTFTTVATGLRNDYTGSIYYEGKDIRSFSPSDWSKIRTSVVSVVFQDLQLFPKLTVRENLKIKNDLAGVYSEDEIKQMLEQLGIGDKWEQSCGLLSMGQQQRVAIIRALLQPFEWLIMDEPFSHLDEVNTQLALKMINDRTVEQGAGFVLTTLGDYHGYAFDQELKL